MIERDSFTCLAAECRLRSRLESDHIRLRSQGGSLETWNQVPMCAAHHRYMKHEVGSLTVRGIAPYDLEVTMGGRVYRNDAIVVPAFEEGTLDRDPWEPAPWGMTAWEMTPCEPS